MRVGIAVENIAILLLAVIFERIIEKTIKLFSICRLKAIGRAPAIHDSYVWVLNVPRSILVLYKYAGKLEGVSNELNGESITIESVMVLLNTTSGLMY